MVELDVQRTTLFTNRNGLIQPPVFQSKVVEQAQCLPGEPTQLMVMPLGFELTDYHQWNHHFVLGEPAAGPGSDSNTEVSST